MLRMPLGTMYWAVLPMCQFPTSGPFAVCLTCCPQTITGSKAYALLLAHLDKVLTSGKKPPLSREPLCEMAHIQHCLP